MAAATTMSCRGGQGDDLYIVNAPLDVVIEAADGGIDTIRSYRSLKLPENVENLEMRSGNPVHRRRQHAGQRDERDLGR